MALHPNEVNNRFKRHRPAGGDDSEQSSSMEHAHQLVGGLARDLNNLLPDGREKSLVMTKLEEALMWSVKAIITPQPSSDGSVSTP